MENLNIGAIMGKLFEGKKLVVECDMWHVTIISRGKYFHMATKTSTKKYDANSMRSFLQNVKTMSKDDKTIKIEFK